MQVFGYGTGFDRLGRFSYHGIRSGKNVVIFGVDMSSSGHVDKEVKDILILRKGPTQRLSEHSLTAEKMYSNNFTEHNKMFFIQLAL